MSAEPDGASVPIPPLMRIENITFCNEGCSFCPYPRLKRSKGSMSEPLYRRLLNEHSRKAVVPALLFPANVGEPLLDRRLESWIRTARTEFNYRSVSIFTNGSLLDRDRAEALISSGLTGITFTIHGLVREEHLKITKADFYDAVTRNIASFLEVNKAMGKPVTVYLNIFANCDAASAENTPLVEHARREGATITVQALDKTHNWAGLVGAARHDGAGGHSACRRIGREFGVLWNGTVVPCCSDAEAEYALGNAGDVALEEVFSGTEYCGLREKNAKGRLGSVLLCGGCDLRVLEETVYRKKQG